MSLQRMQNQDMGSVLSTDSKPRLKWTPELHRRFVQAVTQLGGADEATPKSLMSVMNIPGLTLYHLKSHLQKYRLGKNQQSEICSDNKHEDFTEADYQENEIRNGHISGEIMGKTHTQINESLQIAQALQMQMEVQKKLHEQIEVQRHLQLRIEAQGKYLQSVLKKAQETLAGYNSSSMGLEAAKAEFSELVSMVDPQCLSSSFSGLTETGGLSLEVGKRSVRGTACSMDSSLTSSESSGRKDEKIKKLERGDTHECNRTTLLPLTKIDRNESSLCNSGSSDHVRGRKRSGSTISDETNCVDQTSTKRTPPHEEKLVNQLRKSRSLEELDLNREYQSEMDLGDGELDLNCRRPEPFNESSKHFGA